MPSPRNGAPARLELRDLATAKPLLIEPDGAVFGREGGDAQITIRDMGISKRHARVYSRRGVWFLEDLNSSNGTWIDDQRIRGPVQLTAGTIFSMSQQQYEVVGIHAEAEPTSSADSAPGKPAPSRGKGVDTMAQTAGEVSAEVSDSGLEDEEATRGPAPRPDASRDSLSASQSVADEEEGGVGYFARAVPKAVRYYLGALPSMAINPLGHVRKAIDEQRVAGMGRAELIAYALPANLFTALVAFFCAFVVQLVRGALSIGDIFPLVPLLVAVVVSVVTGFLFHPVVSWLIRFLKGESDARSRSNMFLVSNTASMLAALPAGVAMLLSLVPVPLIWILPLVLSVAATALVGYVTVSWLVYFQVVKWFRIVVLVLFGLAAANAVRAGIVPAPAPEAPVDTEALVREALKDIEAEAAQHPSAEPKAPPVPAVPEPKPVAVAAPQEPSAPKVVPAAPPSPVEPKPPPAKSAPSGYGEYFAQRQAVERAIAEDPTLLDDKHVLALYRRLVRATYEVDQGYEKQTKKEPSEAKVHERLRDAETFRKTARIVNELHRRLFP